MQIRASEQSDYILNPGFGELNNFRLKFGLLTRQTGEGFTLLAYRLMPTVLIKDKIYNAGGFDYTAQATASFSNATQSMKALGLTVAIETGQLLDSTRGLLNLNASYLEYSKLGFTLNQLPQINGLYRLNGGDKMVILGIDGNYDFKTKLFKGSLDVMSYEDYLERET